MHMGPAEAVQAHDDLGAQLSIAAHFQVFQLGPDGYFDAVNELASTLTARDLRPEVFVAPTPGRAIEVMEFGNNQSARSATLSIPAFSPK
jgi:L-ascorbate metabolism protein UlaG (beta-lactamase superfamily)